MENSWLPALAASLLACVVTTVGIFSVRHYEARAREYSIYFVAFAAGVLIAASLLHLMPESFQMTVQAPVYALGGYLTLYVFNRFVCAVVCEKVSEVRNGIGLAPLIGIGLHSFVDGLVYSVTFSVSAFTGGVAAIGMVLHEFPEGVITYLLLLRGGFSQRNAFWLAFIAAAASTPIGTVASYPLIDELDRPMLGALLAVSAGALLYVGATHLLPQVEHERRRFSLLALAAGISVAAIIVVCE